MKRFCLLTSRADGPNENNMLLLPLLLLFGSCFERAYNLRCAHNCSILGTIKQPFALPAECTSVVSSRCSVKLVFWYDPSRYVVTFPGDLPDDASAGDDRHFVMIETAAPSFFSYEINHACKDGDECARRFVERRIAQMQQPTFNISDVYADLRSILHRRSKSTPDLACFDTNDVVRQCAVSGTMGSCQIVDDLVKYRLHRRSCQRSRQASASVNIYDSESFAVMTVKCNRMLCNGPLTVEAVKQVLFRHNITDADGRLLGKSASASLRISLLVAALFVSLQLK